MKIILPISFEGLNLLGVYLIPEARLWKSRLNSWISKFSLKSLVSKHSPIYPASENLGRFVVPRKSEYNCIERPTKKELFRSNYLFFTSLISSSKRKYKFASVVTALKYLINF